MRKEMSPEPIPATELELYRQTVAHIHECEIRSEERAKARHERFNVFTTLLSASDEVRLHTRFLHGLLDPKGFHDCGSLFLDLFLRTLEELPGMDHNHRPIPIRVSSDAGPWNAEKEVGCGEYGQVDLLLKGSNTGLAIENKVYAAEQGRQIERYSNYLKDLKLSSWYVIYLTLDGKRSQTHESEPYVRVSYAEHILEWIERCLRETYRVIPVNQALMQYRQVVRQLTGKSMEAESLDPAVEYVAKHPELVRYRSSLAEATNRAVIRFYDNLATAIMARLSPKYGVELRSELVGGSFGQDRNGAFIIRPPKESRIAETGWEIWVEKVDAWRAIIVGVENKYRKPPAAQHDLELFQRMNKLLDEDSRTRKYLRGAPREIWYGTYWPMGWQDLLTGLDGAAADAQLADLMKRPIEDLADEYSQKIEEYINLLERLYIVAMSDS